MSQEDRLMTEIREANLSYLILAQRLIRTDRAQALFRLGVSEETAELIDALTPTQLMKVAGGSTLLCRMRFDDDIVWNLLADHGRSAQTGEGGNASRLHASILMAGNLAEAIES